VALTGSPLEAQILPRSNASFKFLGLLMDRQANDANNTGLTLKSRESLVYGGFIVLLPLHVGAKRKSCFYYFWHQMSYPKKASLHLTKLPSLPIEGLPHSVVIPILFGSIFARHIEFPISPHFA
jgi:hypothetical protein